MRAVAIFAPCVLLGACGSSSKHAENAPTTNGAIDEAKLLDGAVLGAVNVPVGGSCDLTVRLTPGPYTLACNLVEAMDMNDVHAHFAKGMHVELDVSS